MNKNIMYSITSENNIDETINPYTDIDDLVVGNTYFTNKHDRFKTQDGSRKEYYGFWLGEESLLHMIEHYKNIATSLLLDEFCIPVTIKEINNEKIILNTQNNITGLFKDETTIIKYYPIDDDANNIKIKNIILYFISFLSDNFTSRKSNKIIKVIEHEIHGALNNNNIDIDDFIDNLKLLFKDLVYSLNGKERIYLLEQEIEQDLSIHGVLVNIAYYLQNKIKETDEQ